MQNDMAINFCQAHHSPIISNSHVSRDGYDVSNLISANQATRKHGFCAEYFIKPPVEIILEFPLPIDISHILLGLKVGEQHTTAVEIWSQYQPGKYSYDKNEQFALIGKKFGITGTRVLFLNHLYSSREPFIRFSRNTTSSGIEIVQIQSKQYCNISSAKVLRIRLLKTSGSCAPAVSELEVWGQPARSCGETIIASVLKIEQCSLPSSSSSANKVEKAKNSNENNNLKSKPILNSSISNTVGEDIIPAEFIDPLTCEIMTIPTLLPSGQTVDQRTLEKYCDSEASWGRLPNDPFTGLTFRNDQKPILNLALKARIDQFVLKNTHLLKNIPRTLGNKDMYEKPNAQTSSLLQLSSDDCSEENSNKDVSSVLKRSLVTENISSKKQRQRESEREIFVAEPCSSLDRKGSVCDELRDLQFSRNLDEALKATLSGFKSYSKLTSDVDAEILENKLCCNICLSDAILYRLSCLHLLCRECLVQKSRKSQVICDKCCKPSTVADIARVHV